MIAELLREQARLKSEMQRSLGRDVEPSQYLEWLAADEIDGLRQIETAARAYVATGCGGNAPCGYDELDALEKAVAGVQGVIDDRE